MSCCCQTLSLYVSPIFNIWKLITSVHVDHSCNYSPCFNLCVSCLCNVIILLRVLMVIYTYSVFAEINILLTLILTLTLTLNIVFESDPAMDPCNSIEWVISNKSVSTFPIRRWINLNKSGMQSWKYNNNGEVLYYQVHHDALWITYGWAATHIKPCRLQNANPMEWLF